ncbi:MAG: DNA-3-methyladenine glycosylase family protein [Candidatus Binataceae bacterium]
MKSEVPSYAHDAIKHLSGTDAVMAQIIAQVGELRLAHRPERFQALVRAIIFQQLAGAAASTIFGRFVKMIGDGRFPTPALVLAASDDVMRKAGLSRGKMGYIRDLATHVQNSALNFRRFPRMEDEEIIADLTRVRGIGRWTAEMYLMFNLRRPDVLPVDDLGLRNAVTKAYGMDQPLSAKELRLFGERWRPYRSAAVWYLWQSTRIITPDAPARAVTSRPMRKTTVLKRHIGKTAPRARPAGKTASRPRQARVEVER